MNWFSRLSVCLTRRCSWPVRAVSIPEPLGRQLSGKVVSSAGPRE